MTAVIGSSGPPRPWAQERVATENEWMKEWISRDIWRPLTSTRIWSTGSTAFSELTPFSLFTWTNVSLNCQWTTRQKCLFNLRLSVSVYMNMSALISQPIDFWQSSKFHPKVTQGANVLLSVNYQGASVSHHHQVIQSWLPQCVVSGQQLDHVTWWPFSRRPEPFSSSNWS